MKVDIASLERKANGFVKVVLDNGNVYVYSAERFNNYVSLREEILKREKLNLVLRKRKLEHFFNLKRNVDFFNNEVRSDLDGRD